MLKRIVLLVLLAAYLPLTVVAQEVMVTRYFSGAWDQTEQESQGISLLIIDQAGGEKLGVAYWFTYGVDNESAWFLGVGPVDGNRIELTLNQANGIGFLEADAPGNERVTSIGSMSIEFHSCTEGEVTFETGLPEVGSGYFPIERITDLYNTDCTGGLSDDTPPGVVYSEVEIDLYAVEMGSRAYGEAEFEEDSDETEFTVEVEYLMDGAYRIFTGGEDRGELMVSAGRGKTEFASPADDDEILLTFDPRGEVVEIYDGEGLLVLTSDGAMAGTEGGDDDDSDDGMDDMGIVYGDNDIEVDLLNTGIYPEAKGEAELETDSDDAEFEVEIEKVPAGNYALHLGGEYVGTIVAVSDGDYAQGKLEFSNPLESDSLLLDFDPRGKLVEVLDGETVILMVDFPM